METHIKFADAYILLNNMNLNLVRKYMNFDFPACIYLSNFNAIKFYR